MDENRVIMEFIPETPEETVASHKRREQFARNWTWLKAHILELGEKHRGKAICIAGAEVFVGDTSREAIAQAKSAHPDDIGYFTYYIPKQKYARIYALPR